MSAAALVLRPGSLLQLTTAGINRPSARTEPLKHFASNEMFQATSNLSAEKLFTPRIRLGHPAATPLATERTLVGDTHCAAPTPTRAITLASQILSPDSSAQPAATAGPFCSSVEIEMSPSLVTLQQRLASELVSVHPFLIRRSDRKCSVEFLEPVNLANLTIEDSIVLQRTGEVKFLDDRLRARCRVTVTGIRVPKEELLRTCRENSYTFVSYEGNTWTFIANERDSTPAADSSPGNEEQRALSPPPPKAVTATFQRPADTLSNASPIPASLETSAVSNVVDVRTRARPTEHLATAGLNETLRAYAPHGPSAVYTSSRYTGRESGGLAALTRQPTQDIQLPYELPMSKARPQVQPADGERIVPREPAAVQCHDVLYLSKTNSTLHAAAIKPNTGAVFASHSELFLGRTFRVAWGPMRLIALPQRAELRDGGSTPDDVKEVAGAAVVVTDPFKSVPSYDTVLRTLIKWLKFSGDQAVVDLRTESGSPALSCEKLEELCNVLRPFSATKVELACQAAMQLEGFVSLASALYALPHGDVPHDNPVEDAIYLAQLRRRNMLEWLKAELHREPQVSPENPTQEKKLVRQLLQHDVAGAINTAQTIAPDDVLGRVLPLWGHRGNLAGHLAKLLAAPDANDDRRLINSILAGEAHPFISQRLYTQGSRAFPTSSGVSWKQLLGVFAFYGCTPVCPAEEIFHHFASRFESRRERALAPYCTAITKQNAASPRGQDVLRHGLDVDDACFLLMRAFADKECLPPQALHPTCYTYFATDFMGPFLALIIIRAIGCQRSRDYREAEYRVLVGLAQQLLTPGTWPLAALPIALLEDPQQRAAATARLLAPLVTVMSRDHETMLAALGVNVAELKASRPAVERPSDYLTLRNRPCLTTHAKLQEALKAFTMAK